MKDTLLSCSELVENESKKQCEMVYEVFTKIDTNGDNVLTLDEVLSFINRLRPYTQDQIKYYSFIYDNLL
jgi:hypothetical protein